MDDVLHVDVGAAEAARPAGDIVGVLAVDRPHVERHSRDLRSRRPASALSRRERPRSAEGRQPERSNAGAGVT